MWTPKVTYISMEHITIPAEQETDFSKLYATFNTGTKFLSMHTTNKPIWEVTQRPAADLYGSKPTRNDTQVKSPKERIALDLARATV